MRFPTPLSIKKNETISERERKRDQKRLQESREESFNRETDEKELIKRWKVIRTLVSSPWLLEWKMDPMGEGFVLREEKFRSRTRNNERRRRRGREIVLA